MKKLNTIEIFEELSETITPEYFECLCERVKKELNKKDRRSIELAVKFYGELTAISFLSKNLQWRLEGFSKDAQKYILRQGF